MVGSDSDRGNSRAAAKDERRRVDDVSRRDLQVGSLASWSRALDEQRARAAGRASATSSRPRCRSCSGSAGGCWPRPAWTSRAATTCERIRANAYVLLKRVEELLQVSRLDGGHLELEAARRRRRPPRRAEPRRLRQRRRAARTSASMLDAPLAAAGARRRGEAALRRLQPGGQRAEVRAARRHRALSAWPPRAERLRIEVADSGPGVRRRPARDDLRALPPRRGQRGATRRAPAWGWRSCATSSPCTTAPSPSPTRPRAARSSSSSCRCVDAAPGGGGARPAADDRRRRAPARDRRASCAPSCGPSRGATGTASASPTLPGARARSS